MKKPSRLTLSLFVLLSTAGALLAWEDFSIELFRPRVDVGIESVPKADLQDSGDTFSMHSLTLQGNLPIGKTHVYAGGPVAAYQILAHARAKASVADISFLEDTREFYAGGLAVTGIILGRDLNLYAVALGVSFADDADSLESLEPRFSGVGVGTYRIGNDFAILYGAAFTYLYGQGLGLPIAGAYWRISPRWSVAGMLPFACGATYNAGRDLKIRFLLGVVGERHEFANNDELPGESDDLYFSVTGGRLGAQVDHAFTPNTTVVAEAGVIGVRQLTVADSDEDIRSEAVDATGYARLFLRYTFGESLWQRSRQ
jgi:hypothetical protein